MWLISHPLSTFPVAGLQEEEPPPRLCVVDEAVSIGVLTFPFVAQLRPHLAGYLYAYFLLG